MHINKVFLGIFRNKYFLFFISLCFSILCWLIVSILVDSQTVMTINDVPITNPNEVYFKNMGLEFSENELGKVNIKVQGRRDVVGSLKSSDFSVYCTSQVNISAPGNYNFYITVNKKDPLKEFQILESSKNIINLTLESVGTKTLKVDVDSKHIKISEGYVLGDMLVTPYEKTIKGPNNIIEQIEKISVNIFDEEELSDTKVYTQKIYFLDKNGNKIINDKISLDFDTVDITVPVLKKAVIPLEFTFLNYPSNLDVSKLSYSISTKTIEVAGPREKINSIQSIILGEINMQDFPLDGNISFDVQLPTSFLNINNVTSVTVSFDMKNISTKSLNVLNLTTINAPNNFNVEILTKRLSGVTMIGNKAQINSLYSNDLVGEVDLNLVDISTGEFTIPVTVKSLSKDMIWYIGTYTVIVKITPSS